ncbi:MAG TPA: hypothetical protein VGC74_16920 [Stenotrophomonas sp.]|jgi:hypothetical protein
MYVRFTVLDIDPDSGRASGVLVVASNLRDGGALSPSEQEAMKTAIAWFNDHLSVPALLQQPSNCRAICWFKPAAAEAVRRMWQLKSLLDPHGHHVEVLRTARPGMVIYEDEWQVVAQPAKGQRFQAT